MKLNYVLLIPKLREILEQKAPRLILTAVTMISLWKNIELWIARVERKRIKRETSPTLRGKGSVS